LHLLSHYNTSLDPTGTPTQSPCALVQFLFSKFLPILCFYVWQQLIRHNIYPSQNRVPIFIPCCISLPLSGSSLILPSRNYSHWI
jgi:hypothetical protein